MTILEALIQLRNDLKLWVANNLKTKQNKNLGTNNEGKILSVNAEGEIEPTQIIYVQDSEPDTTKIGSLWYDTSGD